LYSLEWLPHALTINQYFDTRGSINGCGSVRHHAPLTFEVVLAEWNLSKFAFVGKQCLNDDMATSIKDAVVIGWMKCHVVTHTSHLWHGFDNWQHYVGECFTVTNSIWFELSVLTP
jgi:hypothetical protein